MVFAAGSLKREDPSPCPALEPARLWGWGAGFLLWNAGFIHRIDSPRSAISGGFEGVILVRQT